MKYELTEPEAIRRVPAIAFPESPALMHLKERPLVSVIIPCFNRERLVTCEIESALAQASVRKEIIVIDDGSTYASWSAITSSEDKIKAIKSHNRGVAAARNRFERGTR
jgi:GT2 family glycosyltransferase